MAVLRRVVQVVADSSMHFWLVILPLLAFVIDWAVFVPIDNYVQLIKPRRSEEGFIWACKNNVIGNYRFIGILASSLIFIYSILTKNIFIAIIAFLVFALFNSLLHFTKIP